MLYLNGFEYWPQFNSDTVHTSHSLKKYNNNSNMRNIKYQKNLHHHWNVKKVKRTEKN